jgi:hypothetical protein
MSHNIVGSIVPLFNRQNTGKGRKARQTIGKHGRAVVGAVKLSSNSSQTIVRTGAGSGNLRGEDSRRIRVLRPLENLLASHRGEVRPKAAEVQNHRRAGIQPLSVIPVCGCRERAVFRLGKLVKLTIVLEPFRMRFEMPEPRS